ncbi:MAG: NADH:ubiquinone reductase (Na(+)-transporting) subunit B [Rikenellaceae bacterium]
MKAIRDLVDKVKPAFEKDGKFSYLHSSFDAVETFLFTPNTTTSKGAHIRDCNDLKRTMIMVIVALMPAFIFGMYNLGLQNFMMLNGGSVSEAIAATNIFCNLWFGFIKVLPLIIVSYGVGLGIEIAFAQMRGHEVNEGYLVSGLLIPMIMPIDIPLWMLAISVVFAVVIGKEVFGGTGMNVFNPALLARAFAFFAYTPQMSGETVWIAEMTGNPAVADGFSGATALEHMASTGQMGYSMCDAFLGFIPGSMGETSTLAILIGAAILLFTGIASWRTMVSVFVGGLAMGALFNAFGAEGSYLAVPACHHMIVGGFAFGAVFMATDPVTSGQTNCAKIIVGFMTGAIAILIRVINPAYPEGMMLSILFMNALAPLVDYYVVEGNIARRNARLKQVK